VNFIGIDWFTWVGLFGDTGHRTSVLLSFNSLWLPCLEFCEKYISFSFEWDYVSNSQNFSFKDKQISFFSMKSSGAIDG